MFYDCLDLQMTQGYQGIRAACPGIPRDDIKLRRERVYPRLMWRWSFLFPPNSQEPPLENIYILLHKLLRELLWERTGARKDIWSFRVSVLLQGGAIAAPVHRQLLTFKSYYLCYLTLWNHIATPVCMRRVFRVISLARNLIVYLCEYVLRDGRRGDAYDPLRRRKNKQNRNEEEEAQEAEE